MAEKFSAIQWFLKELPHLQEDGLLDETSAVRLKEHYEERLAKKPSAKNYFLLAIGLIGGLMIAAGIILVINYNWDMFSKPVRVGISAVPLLIGMTIALIALIKEKDILLNELGAIITATGGATLLAMISQIYHMGGDFHDFMMLNLALALPLIYVFNSIGLASIYVFGLYFMLPDSRNASQSDLYYVGYILLILPYLLYYQIKGETYRIWTRYLLGSLALTGLLASCANYYFGFSCFAVAAAVWLTGREFAKKGDHYFRNPWQYSGFLFLLILFATSSCNKEFFEPTTRTVKLHSIPSFWLFNALLFAAIIRHYIKQKITAEKVVLGVWLLLLFLPFVLEKPFAGQLLEILAVIFMIVLGLVLLFHGYRTNQLEDFNAGFLLIALQLICRFFDADYGLLFRATGFIILGIGFISANVILRKKISREVPYEKA